MDTQLRGTVRVITAEVPLVEMFGYTTILRGLTQGRASSSMEPNEYRLMPDRLRDEVLARTGNSTEPFPRMGDEPVLTGQPQ